MKPNFTWTRERIIQAAQEWEAQYGEPPRSMEWGVARPSYPHRSTVIAVFGSWNEMIEAAGFTPRPRYSQGRAALELLREAVAERDGAVAAGLVDVSDWHRRAREIV